MNTSACLLSRTVGAAILFPALALALAGAARADDRWDRLTVGTNELRNASIVHNTPVEVVFKHEGGYLRVRRPDLTGPLKERFPYDAQKADAFLRQQADNKRMEAINNREALARQRIQTLEQEQEKIRAAMRSYRGKKGRPDRGKLENFKFETDRLEKEKILAHKELNQTIEARIALQLEIAAAPRPAEPPPANPPAKKKKKKK